MLSVRDAQGAEYAALKTLAVTARALLEATGKASINVDGRAYYHLPTLLLLEFAAATRTAEEIVKNHDQG